MTNQFPNTTVSSREDEQILDCLNLENPKSFFLFAGAGSGKTRSLVNALANIHKLYGEYFRINKKKVGVITYTNAACEEIKNRIEHNPLFFVSTIHSFVWELIKHYHVDIKQLLKQYLINDIAILEEQLKKGRSGTKIQIEREIEIEQKSNRLNYLEQIRQFTYNPNGDNRTKDSLNHSEVIKIASSLLKNKPLMQEILVQKYPVLFIDESQDTKKELIESLFEIQQQYKTSFCMGLFGDTMQRIYNDGKENLGKNLPNDWVTPLKKINYRCSNRIVALINQLRSSVDNQVQESKPGQTDGHVKLFIAQRNVSNKNAIEENIAKSMEEFTNDSLWADLEHEVKILILEHHMAARRMGFINLFESIGKSETLRMGLIDGTLSGLRFFTEQILPLRNALINNDKFTAARIVKKYSTLLYKKRFESTTEQMQLIKEANEGVISLNNLWNNGSCPTLLQIVLNIHETGLFSLPDSLSIISKRIVKGQKIVEENLDEELNEVSQISAWDAALQASFEEIERYHDYISDNSRFGTHQGVKGLEFPRVMVIIDDEEARGFLFSYEKIFGVKAPTDTDLKNIKEGKETSIDRTLRLFYVACSRAEKSLAIVAYTENPELLKNNVMEKGWFTTEEIEMV